MLKVNGIRQEYFLFPNNEIKIKPIIIDDCENIKIEFIYQNSIDITNLIFVKKYLDDTYPNTKVNLLMKYIPYERLDRYMENQMFTCKYFGQFINDLNFNKVIVLDPHSNVSIGVLNKVEQIPVIENIYNIFDIEDTVDAIFLPDVGANKKYTELLDGINIPMFWGNKHRDLETGAITDYEIIGSVNIKDKTILVVDDICVKGYTTLFASKKLKELGAKRVIFYCSHCEDSIHTGELLKTDYVDHIYTTDSLVFDEHDKITII